MQSTSARGTQAYRSPLLRKTAVLRLCCSSLRNSLLSTVQHLGLQVHDTGVGFWGIVSGQGLTPWAHGMGRMESMPESPSCIGNQLMRTCLRSYRRPLIRRVVWLRHGACHSALLSLCSGAGYKPSLQHHRGAHLRRQGCCGLAEGLAISLTHAPTNAGTAGGWVHASQAQGGQRYSSVHAHAEPVQRLCAGSHGHTSLSGAQLRQHSSGGLPLRSVPAQVRSLVQLFCCVWVKLTLVLSSG